MATRPMNALAGPAAVTTAASVNGYDRLRHGIHQLRRPEVIADPLRYVDAVAELGPVFFDEVGRVWVCSGYPESVLALTDDRRFSGARLPSSATLDHRGLEPAARTMQILRDQMLFADGPRHSAIRSSIREHFSATRIREHDDRLMRIAEDALDMLPGHGLVDLVADFAGPLPTRLMADLLGMPGRDADLVAWADAYERLLGSLSTLPDIRDNDIIAVLDEAMCGFTELARHRLREPGDDLISSLVAGLTEGPDDRAGLHAVAANCVVLVGGGYQTLTHLVSTGLMLLDAYPDQQRLLRDDPDHIDRAIDEIMRLDGSSQYVARQACVDVRLGEHLIRCGQTVVVLLAAANLDPRQFERPREFDITRRVGKQLGFALGRHHCIGAPYAKRLARWAILGFLARYPSYRMDLSTGAQLWGSHANTRCRVRARAFVQSTFGQPGLLATSPTAAPTPVARHRVLVECNDTQVPLGTLPCWHHIFEDRARRDPYACAVDDDGRRYTYADLDQRANAFAHHLRDEGVEPEAVVAVLTGRGVDLVVAALAVAKAGGAFLLVDPRCPGQRVRAMLAEAAVSLVIVDTVGRAVLDRLALAGNVRVADVADGAEVGRLASGLFGTTAPPVSGVSAGHTAYLVFTSGTTGQPKAIANSHLGLVALHVAQRRVFGLRAGDRVLQFLSPNFDGCVFDLILALLGGAELVFAKASDVVVGPPLARTLRDREITAVLLTPSVWAALPDAALPRLRIAVAVGERLKAAVVNRWSAPGRRLLNLYGPAEAAIWTTWHECQPGPDDPPIGRPIPNKRVYVLDEALDPVPVGQEGELCVAGLGIGRYLGQPALMRRHFTVDPFGNGPGDLLYRTGDRARWRPDGTLEYVGRRDRQVKIRGQRIELDEVERVLDHAPGVEACVVGLHDGRLVASVVPSGDGFDEVAVRSYLSDRLHTGAVPTSFSVVADLPRTPSGKVAPGLDTNSVTNSGTGTETNADANIGTAVEAAIPAASSPVLPEARLDGSELTERITELFAGCLGVAHQRVGAASDFFTLGGDSLAVAALLTGLEKEAGQVVDIEVLLRNPTPAGISHYLFEANRVAPPG